jgi:hypothetical protein
MQRLGDVLHDNQGIAAISQLHLPSNSPDLTPADFFFIGVFESSSFCSHPPWH